MTDYKEKLLKEFEYSLLPHFSTGEIGKISDLLVAALLNYRVEEVSRDIIVYDDHNDKLLKAYENCMAIECKSPQTIKAYRGELRRLADTIGKNYDKMTTTDIRYYMGKMRDRNVTSTTLENSRSYMSAFFKWMTDEGLIAKNPMAPIKPIKTNPKSERPFSGGEIDSLRLACNNNKERAVIEVALSSGLRRGELAKLEITDVDLKNLEVHVRHGKGDKARTSYIDDIAAKYVAAYLAERKDELNILFLSQLDGGCGYTEGGISKLICRVGKRAGVSNVHPHRFRHTMASQLYKRGMPLNEIQRILGHTNINTTMRYVHTDDSAIKSSYRKLLG